MKIAGREVLCHIRYREIECPDAGTVSVFDYISAGTMTEFADHRSDSEAALSAVIRSSLQDPDASFSKLTSNDFAAIARHLVSVAGVIERFDAKLQDSELADAFVHAIEESSEWKSHLETEKKLRRAVQHSIRPFNSVIRKVERHRSMILEVSKRAEFLRQFEKTSIPLIHTAFVNLESFKSFASKSAQTINELGRIGQDAMANLERWNGIVRQIASQTRLASSVLTRQQDLTRMIDRLNQIKPLVAPIAKLSSGFADITSRLGSATSLSDDLLSRADSGLAESKLLTLETSDFFAHGERPFEFAQIDPVLPRELVEQEEEIQSAYEEGEIILHEESALIVAEGTSLAEIIRRAIGDEFDQRLGKYGALLARLEKLSKPAVFHDLLREFSAIASREYWASLWTDPGNTWQSHPERHAQAMLGMFLHGKWADVAFVGREIANGNGFVDLLVNFMARDYIVELKMIGAGWPVSNAESGLPQLEQYMAKYRSQEAYLVVFDGRKTSRGRQLPEKHETKRGTIQVVVVPAYSDAPSSH